MTRVHIDDATVQQIDSNKGLIKHVIYTNIVYDYLYDAGLGNVQQIANPDYLLIIDNMRFVNENLHKLEQLDYTVDAFGFFMMYETLFMESLLRIHFKIMRELRYRETPIAVLMDGLWLSLYERQEDDHYVEIDGPEDFVRMKANIADTLGFIRNRQNI
jgi:hypothetical protein